MRYTRKIPDFNYMSHMQFLAANGWSARPQTELRWLAWLRTNSAYIQGTGEIERKCATVLFFFRGTCPFSLIQTKVRIPGLANRCLLSDAAMRRSADRIAEDTCSRVSTGSVVSQQTASRTEKLDRVPAAREQNFTTKWRPGRGKLSYANRRIPVCWNSNRGRRHDISGTWK